MNNYISPFTITNIMLDRISSIMKKIGKLENYKDLKKTIGIVITNYEVKELKGIEQLDTKWQIICDKNDKRLLTEDLELRIIEIPKARRIIEKEKYNRIAQWLLFLDNPNTERVEEIMKENEEVKKANDVLYEMSEDEMLQRLAELREKWDLDERSALGHAIEDTKIEIAKKMKEEKKKDKNITKTKKLLFITTQNPLMENNHYL